MKGVQNNKNVDQYGFEAVGTSMKTPQQYSSKTKENSKQQSNIQQNPFSSSYAQIKSNKTIQPPNPYIVQHNQKEIQGLNIIGKRMDDAKSTKDILEKMNIHTFKESQKLDDEEYIKEAKDFEEKHVVKRVTKSGGFKIPEQTIEKQHSHRRQQPQPIDQPLNPNKKQFDDTRNDAGMSRLEILQQLGITDETEGVNYDRLQDRIYDTQLDEQLSLIVEDQVFNRLDQIHHNRDQLIKKKEQVQKEKEKLQKEKQENWDRLTGKQKYKPKYLNQNEIEEEEFEESNNLEKEAEEYYTQKYNLELSDRLKRVQEEEDDSKKSYKDRFFDEKSRFSKSKKSGNQNGDEVEEDIVDKFFQTLEGMEKPTLEETQQTIAIQRKKLRYLEKQMKRSKGIPVSSSEEEIEEEEEQQHNQSQQYKSQNSQKGQYQRSSPRNIQQHQRQMDKSPLNIQSTISHSGGYNNNDKNSNQYYGSSQLRSSLSNKNQRTPNKSQDKNRVSIKVENYDSDEQQHYDDQGDYEHQQQLYGSRDNQLQKSHSIEQKLQNVPKFQNPYRRGDSLNNNQRSKSPLNQQQQQQQYVDPEVKDYEKFEKEFKTYVSQRKKREQVKHLEQSLEKKDFELYQSTSPNPVNWSKKPVGNLVKSYEKSISPERMDQSGGLNNSKLDTNSQNKQQELKMIQTLFDKIDKEQTGLIDKLDTVKYLINQKQIMSIYDLKSENLNRHVQSFPTEKKGNFTYEEFVRFLQTPRDIFEKKTRSGNYFTDEIKQNKKKQIKQQNQQKDINDNDEEICELNEGNSTCLLQTEHIRIMRELYMDLDKHNDMIVSRKQYLDKLRSDVRIVKILHLPAVYMPSIDKTMNVDRVLYRIEQEQFIGDTDSKSTKEYITWTQFLDYFNDIKSLKKGNENNTKEKIKQIKVFSTIKDNVDDQNEVDMEQGIREILETEYNNMPKHSETYVHTFQYIENIKMNNKYPSFTNSLARRKADKFPLKDELFCDTLDRMEAEADEYIDFEEIMEFFTRRGRPKYAVKKEEDKEFKEKYATIPRQKDNENLFNSKMRETKEQNLQDSFKLSQNNSNYMDQQDEVEEIDGYDSDPETHIYRRGYQPQRKNLSRPKSAFNRSLQRSKSPGRESGFQGLSQSITKSYVVDRRNSGQNERNQSDQEHDEDQNQYYSSNDKINRKKNKYYGSDGEDADDDINQRYLSDDQSYPYHPQQQQQQQQQYSLNRNPKQDNYTDSKSHFDSQKNLHEQRGDYKKAMFDYYAGEVGSSKSKKFKLTKPEPYKFDERERERKQSKTIRQRKVEEMVEEVREKERREYNTRPKPKEIPDHVKKPLYEKIMHEQDKRRQEVRTNSVAITIQREKPFKFYIRDKNPDTSLKRSKRKTWEERESFVFKANKVPWFCSTNLLEKINRDEELKRQERVAKQAQKTMAMSKLPPRMEKHEQERRARELMEGYSGLTKMNTMNPLKREMFQEPSFQPPKAKTIPNFNKMHAEFQDKLDKQRKGKRPTEVKAFNFQESRKLPPRDYLDQENELMRLTKTKPAVDKLEEAKKWRNHKPKYQPPSIKKWEQNVERIQKEKEKKEEQLKKEKELEEQKLKKREELAKIVREKYSKNNQTVKLQQKQKEAVERKKKEFKESEEQYTQKKNEILSKVKERPLLMEQKCKGRAYLEKLKTLDRIDNRLKDRGMNSKERQSMYTKDEIKMLQEIKALKARGFKSFRNELDVGDDVSLSPPREDYDYDQLEKELGEDNNNYNKKSKQNNKKKSIEQSYQDSDSDRKKDDLGSSKQLKSFLNSNKNDKSNNKKEFTDEQLNDLNNLIDDEDDHKDNNNKYHQSNNKLSSNNYINTTSNSKSKPVIRQTESVSNLTGDSLDNKKDQSSSSINNDKKINKESNNTSKTTTNSNNNEKKIDPVEEKKNKLKEMKLDSIESGKSDDNYELEEFDPID